MTRFSCVNPFYIVLANLMTQEDAKQGSRSCWCKDGTRRNEACLIPLGCFRSPPILIRQVPNGTCRKHVQEIN